jgi:hypothetical protein
MNKSKALATAPLAVFPVALVFVLLRSLIGGDWRELFAAPFSAAMITAVGYPFVLAAVWSASRIMTRFGAPGRALIVAAAVVLLEAVFWLVISPFWRRDFSNAFCAAMVGASGLVCAATFLWLSSRPSTP